MVSFRGTRVLETLAGAAAAALLIGVVTNWTSFYGNDLELPGCKQSLLPPMIEVKPELGHGSAF